MPTQLEVIPMAHRSAATLASFLKAPARGRWLAACLISVTWLTGADVIHATTKLDPGLTIQTDPPATQRVIVIMRPDPEKQDGGASLKTPASYIAGVLGTSNGTPTRIGTLPMVTAEVNPTELKRLSDDPNVARIIRDVPMKPMLMDSVPLVGASDLHKSGQTGEATAVAVLDTGVDPNHPALAGSVATQACFSTKSSTVYKVHTLCPNGEDVSLLPDAATGCRADIEGCDHGTHVAGIVAGHGMTYDDRNFVGVAPKSQVVAVQVFSLFEDEALCGALKRCVLSFTSDQLRALEWVYKNREKHRIAAVNMSLGSGYYDAPCDDTSALTEIIERLRAKGIPTVVAAGNEQYYDGIAEPACISFAYAVAATKKSGEFDTSYSNFSKQVRIVAPGTEIVSAKLGGGYKALSGTSMAAPHVAGAFALLRAGHPKASILELEAKLDPSNKLLKEPRTGAAVQLLALSDGASITSQPLAEILEGAASKTSSAANSANIIVKVDPTTGADEGQVAKSLDGAGVDAALREIAPNTYAVEITPKTDPGGGAGGDPAAIGRAIGRLQGETGVKVYDNRLSVPKLF